MKNLPLISVNITTYNRAKQLVRYVEAVKKQSYPNMEIIIVDDNSTDNTQTVIDPYLQDPRFLYIKHKINKGNAAARNTAWRNSKGEYIAFMDDDDIWIDATVNSLR